MRVIVTTDKRPTEEMIREARSSALKFKTVFYPRRHNTINYFKKKFNSNVLVVNKDLNLTLYTLKGQKLFFHPGLFKIRLLNYLATKNEAMIKAMNLKEGDTVLDCNLGLAQDALLAAFVSKREVVGIEKEPVIYEIVKRGLESYEPKGKLKIAEETFKLIKPLLGDNEEYLKNLPDKAFDVVYFSPMFIKPKWHCDVMSQFREVAGKYFVSAETLKEAERVAKRRVVIKINKGVKEMFPFLKDYVLQESSTNVEYIYKDVS